MRLRVDCEARSIMIIALHITPGGRVHSPWMGIVTLRAAAV